MLTEILHELINAAEHRIGLDRAGELRDLADKLELEPAAAPKPADSDAPAAAAPKPADSDAPAA
jgi:hypothetical protein